MAPGSQWLRSVAGGHWFWRRTRCRGRRTLTPESVEQRAAGGLRRRVRDGATGSGLAAIRRGDALFGAIGHGLADYVDDVERGGAVVVAAVGYGPRVVGVFVGFNGISGNRLVCLGCGCHAGGTSHSHAL